MGRVRKGGRNRSIKGRKERRKIRRGQARHEVKERKTKITKEADDPDFLNLMFHQPHLNSGR